jgi:predicted phosphatase
MLCGVSFTYVCPKVIRIDDREGHIYNIQHIIGNKYEFEKEIKGKGHDCS